MKTGMMTGMEATMTAVGVVELFIGARKQANTVEETNKLDAAMLATICTMVADEEYETALKTLAMIGEPEVVTEEKEFATDEQATEETDVDAELDEFMKWLNGLFEEMAH